MQELFHQLDVGGGGRRRRTGDKWSEKKQEKIGCWAEVDEWPAERNMGLRKWKKVKRAGMSGFGGGRGGVGHGGAPAGEERRT